MKEPESTFKIHDIVRVVDTPYKDCPFGWTDEMDEFCGEETIITDVYWSADDNCHVYFITADREANPWCENCFVMEPDLEESDSNSDGEMKDRIFSFFWKKGIPLRKAEETIFVTESGCDYEAIKVLWRELVSAGFAVAGNNKSSKLPKLFLLSPLSGDMCKYELEIDFGGEV